LTGSAWTDEKGISGMPNVSPEIIKKFLTTEIVNGPLAEFISAEPLSLYLDQYLTEFCRENILPLEALGAWLETEHQASAGTVQLVFERLQAKAQKRGMVLLLPGQTPPTDAAAACPSLKPEDLIRVKDRNTFVSQQLDSREKTLLIFLDGQHTLDQLSARTKMSVEEIAQFLQKHWGLGQFQLATADASAPAGAAPPPSSPEYPLPDEFTPLKYGRKPSPAAKKAGPVPAKPAPTAAVSSGLASTRQKAIAGVVLLVMVVCAVWAVSFVLKMRSHQSVEVRQLQPADYAAILPLSAAVQAGQAFVGTLDQGRWNRLTREQKLDACQKLYLQVKSEDILQVQLRANSGEFLALVSKENHISILR
jgi:hypothetical protein